MKDYNEKRNQTYMKDHPGSRVLIGGVGYRKRGGREWATRREMRREREGARRREWVIARVVEGRKALIPS